jgi:ATP-dependent Clp protease ATP-binding subunit ClpC
MFEHYSDKARRVIFFARFEAGRYGTPQIEAEHLVLGLAREDPPLMGRFLSGPPGYESFQNEIQARTPVGKSLPTNTDLPVSEESKRVLAFTAEEADRLGHKRIGTEHLLLGVLREEQSFAAKMLRDRGAKIEEIRTKLAAGSPPGPPGRAPRSPSALSDSDFSDYT